MSRIANISTSALVLVAASLLLTSCAANSAEDEGSTYSVYFLGGQSNMDGFGYVSELPADLNGPVLGARIFHGNPVPDDSAGGGRGLWSDLRPGHGTGFSSDGANNLYSERFGIEQTFALRLRELDPDANIALVKYSRGGTSIDAEAAREYGSWDPSYADGDGINQYDHFLATLNDALSARDIDGDSRPDSLVPAGIIWMQGESDADCTEEIARRYQDNLTTLMGLIRDAFGAEDVPVVIGRISNSGQDDDGLVWEHMDVVRDAQLAFVEGDAAAALVTSTDEYGYSDPWHYDTEGYIDLGRRFADAVEVLQGGR